MNFAFYDYYAWIFQLGCQSRTDSPNFHTFSKLSTWFAPIPTPTLSIARVSCPHKQNREDFKWIMVSPRSPRNSKVDLDWREWSMECSKSNVRRSRETICEMFFKPALAVCSVWLSSINILCLCHNISVASTDRHHTFPYTEHWTKYMQAYLIWRCTKIKAELQDGIQSRLLHLDALQRSQNSQCTHWEFQAHYRGKQNPHSYYFAPTKLF